MAKYTLETANKVLVKRGLSTRLKVTKIDGKVLTVNDVLFGEYKVDLKSLSPSMSFPLHRDRKHFERLRWLKKKYVGKEVKGLRVLDIFYGPDHGYKNRSFYFSFKGVCGHSGVSTYAHLSRHRKILTCHRCKPFKHGERRRFNGVLGKRSPAYLVWVAARRTLPEKYQDFKTFKSLMGDKPPRAKIEIIGGRPRWVEIGVTQDKEINLIAMAVRQAFRRSKKYKACVEAARVETNLGVRFRCAQCRALFKRNEIQVDHVIPIKSLDGSPLKREEIFERILDSEIQILDRKCHLEKTLLENEQRKKARKKIAECDDFF